MFDKTFKSLTDYRYTLKLGLKIFTFKTIFILTFLKLSKQSSNVSGNP